MASLIRQFGHGFESSYNFVHARIEGRERERFLQERQRTGILAHGLIILHAAPSRIHGHLCTIDATMQRRRDKTWRAVDETIGRAREKIDKPLLVGLCNREYVNERDDAVFLGCVCHKHSLESE